MLTKLIATAVLCTSLTSVCFAKDKAATLRDQQQAACYDDAQRLCGDAMPDVDKVMECMKPRKAEVSAPCAAFYK